MVGFMDFHKMVGKSSFLVFSSAQNESEWKGGPKSEELKFQFSQVEGDLNLQKMFKLVPIPQKKHQRKIKL